jgi:choline dehydrogenase-like flavoprotein
MILDFGEMSSPTDLHSDLCIIGAGAAGITLAREFAGLSAKVIVLESGGAEFDQETQDLYVGENTGLPYDVELSRLRFLGGTTNHWEGVCGPLDEIDFQVRSWVPHSGWPFSKDELVPFYERAQVICGVGPYLYGDGVWAHIGRDPLDLDQSKIQYGFSQMREFPVRFGEEYAEDIEKSESIQLFLHANVTNIQLSNDRKRIDFVNVRALQGASVRVFARYFVLACGAIENARILLVSNSVDPAGIGNGYDLVGRYFQEHPRVVIGEVFPNDDDEFRGSFLQEFVDGIRYVQHLKASSAIQTRNHSLNCSISLDEILKPDTGMAAAREIMGAIRRGKPVDDLGEKIWRVLMDLDDVTLNAYRRFVLGEGTRPPIERIELQARSEQAPNAESRVTLLPEKDALGMNRVRLNWVLTDLERQSLVGLAKTLASELGRLGLGRVKLSDEMLRENDWPTVYFGSHHLGTTRMADDPSEGVVDRNCLIHGLSNIYVAGSSVFPTGGFMNPTLTIVALALRLSDRLKSGLA